MHKTLGFFLFIYSFSFAFGLEAAFSAPSPITTFNYLNTEGIALKLIDRCPPSTCIPIFVGRSGVMVAAFLEAYYGTPSIQIPLSKFRHNPEYETGDHPDTLKLVQSLDPKMEATLYPHFLLYFAHYNLKPEQLQNKKMLIVDFSQTGRGLFAFTAYFERWLQNEKVSASVSALPLVRPFFVMNLIPMALKYKVRLERPIEIGYLSGTQFWYAGFDKYAPFGTFNLLDDALAISPINPRYPKLVKVLKELQAKDFLILRLKKKFNSTLERAPNWLKQLICIRALSPHHFHSD